MKSGGICMYKIRNLAKSQMPLKKKKKKRNKQTEILEPKNSTCELKTGICHHLLHGLNHEPLSCQTTAPPQQSSGWKSGVRHSGLWENWKNRSSESQTMFKEKILCSQFLHLLISRQTLKSFMVMSAPCDWQGGGILIQVVSVGTWASIQSLINVHGLRFVKTNLDKQALLVGRLTIESTFVLRQGGH